MKKEEHLIRVRRRLRRTGARNASMEATLPKLAVLRELRKNGLTFEEADALWEYNGFDGILLKVVPKNVGGAKR